MAKLTQAEVAQDVAKVARWADLDDDNARDAERVTWEKVLIAAADGQDVRKQAQAALGTRAHVFGRCHTR